MLQAPTSETNTETAQSKTQRTPLHERELHPHSFGAAGLYSQIGAAMPGDSPSAQRHQTLAGMHSTYGNQAVLRMLNNSQQVTHPMALRHSQGVMLQRKCACGGTPGPTGECAECKAKREAMVQRPAANFESSS